MEESFKALLQLNKLEHLAYILEESGITNSEIAVLLQDESDLKELIPTLVDRLRFKALLKTLKADTDVSIYSQGSSDTVIIEPDGSFSTVIECHESQANEEEMPSTSIVASSAENVGHLMKKRKLDISEETTRKSDSLANNVKVRNVVKDISFDMFNQILENSAGSIVKEYYKNNGYLNSKMRSLLVSSVISSLVASLEYSLPTTTIESLSDHIVSTFPNECKESYFLITKQGSKHVYSGRLYTKYKNHRQVLLSAKKIESPHSKITKPEPSDDIKKKLLFLKNSISPWKDICSAWEDTRTVRLENNNCSSLMSITEMYPAIKQKDGFMLVSKLHN